jgi:uncharacterized protein
MKVGIIRYILVLAFAALWVEPASAQQQPVAGIGVRANIKNGAIQLRWAVSTPMAWKQSNAHGFKVERLTVVRDGEMLSQPERVVLTSTPLKPQPLNNWQTLATSNNYAAVIAQALYGQDFNLSEQDAKGVSRFIALAQELEQRYLVSMYAADLCYPAALLAGWGLEDKTVKPGERYLYRVISAVPEKTLKIDMGTVYSSLADASTLPQPQELTAVFGDKSVMLTWNYGMLSSVYNAYFLEKSVDGKNFIRLSDIPLANMNSKDGRAAERMFFTDSLKDNVSRVHYRLIGVTPFGEEGPASDTVKGEGKNRLIYVPHINRAVPDKEGVLTVEWEFDQKGNSQLKGFDLQRSENVKGPYTSVIKNIDPARRAVTYDSLLASNYFVIAAVPKEGEPVLSFPVLVQPSDTIPPKAPTGLLGVVDSLGVVRLTWKANKEPDLYGYRIYRAQTKGEELVPLTDKAVIGNMWVDTVQISSLNSTVYYAVTALDKRYNQSPQSEAVALKKPEVVPPSAPVITGYKLTKQAIWLEFATGNEDNLAAIQVMRAERGSKEMKLLKAFTDSSIRSFKDSTVQADKFYSYQMFSVTTGGLRSAPSPVVTVQAPAYAGQTGNVTDFVAKFNRKTSSMEIRWKHNISNIKQYDIYRNGGGKGFTLKKSVKGYEAQIEDTDIKPEVSYEYMLRVVLENGKVGATATTKPVKVK